MRTEDPQAAAQPVSLDDQAPLDTAGQLHVNTLADSVLLLMAVTVLQRSIGFVREVFFCRWLSAEELGRWDMAFGFLMLAAPLAVVSLPGTFGRYLDRYRRTGHLRMFLRRTALFCAATALPAALGIAAARRQFSYLIFGTPERTHIVVLLAGGMLIVVAFNYLICLATAMRNMRWVCGIELVSSLFFAIFGLGLLWCGSDDAGSMVVAYTAACAVCVLGGLVWLAWMWRGFPHGDGPAPHRELWSRLLPLAGWIMVINLLWNVFDVAGRYMIVHFYPGSPAEALACVGNYRSARVLPLLLASLTVLIATAALPHLSHDWEAGRRHRVSARVNMLLKVWAMVLTAAGTAVLLAAPLLFRVALQGKFSGGFDVLPWTLTYCTWFGLTMIAQNYLWCAEKARLAGLAALIGVVANVGLNFVLLPRLGLLGAVLAATAANAAALAMMLLLGRRFGLQVHRGTVATVLLPLSISLGPWVACLAIAAFALEIVGSDRLLSREEKQELASGAARYLDWIRPRLPSLPSTFGRGAR